MEIPLEKIKTPEARLLPVVNAVPSSDWGIV
jgi:hypothetical protein